jgi:hypothetical protein
MENENLEKLKKLYADIDESMKLMAIPKVMIKGSQPEIKPGIYPIRVKQPDRFIMWLKFKWFKLTQPKRYRETVEFVERIREAQLVACGIAKIKTGDIPDEK